MNEKQPFEVHAFAERLVQEYGGVLDDLAAYDATGRLPQIG